MKFTIFGATGFIGRHLSAYLTSVGHEVYLPDRNIAESYKENLGHVIYCIGLTADFRDRPFDTVRAHVSVLADVLEKTSFESFLYLSSTRVYARSATGDEDAALLSNVLDPSDLYNLTKLAGESLCLSCGISRVRVVRLSNVVGHDSVSENFLSSLVKEALSGKILLRSALSSVKDYVLLDDVVRMLSLIAESGRERIYNLASGMNLAHGEIVKKLGQLTGCEIVVSENAPVSRFPVIDIKKIKEEFSFSPKSALDSLQELVVANQSTSISNEPMKKNGPN